MSVSSTSTHAPVSHKAVSDSQDTGLYSRACYVELATPDHVYRKATVSASAADTAEYEADAHSPHIYNGVSGGAGPDAEP